LHDSKLGESGKREKIFASTEGASLCMKGHGIVLDLPKNPAQAFFFIYFYFIDTLPAILAKPVIGGRQQWPDMISNGSRLTGASGRIHGQLKQTKDNERKFNL
jgi:hypothetical protein